jgi:hypothetical protein
MNLQQDINQLTQNLDTLENSLHNAQQHQSFFVIVKEDDKKSICYTNEAARARIEMEHKLLTALIKMLQNKTITRSEYGVLLVHPKYRTYASEYTHVQWRFCCCCFSFC